MSNLRLLGNSHADGVTINATSEETNYPIENIQIPQQSLKWRSTSAAIQKLWCKFTTPLPCSGFALWAHNLSHNAVVKFTLFNNAASTTITGAVHSSGIVTITTSTAHGLNIPATLLDAISSKLVTANYPMYDIDVGIGAISDARTSNILIKDYNDVYQEFGSADLPYYYGRVTGSVDSLIVYDDDGSTELTNTPMLQHSPAGTNFLLSNKDNTTGDWNDGASPIKYANVAGVGGSLTAFDIEDDSVTVAENIYTDEYLVAEGDNVVARCWLKKAGSGSVQMVINYTVGGSSSEWGSINVNLNTGASTPSGVLDDSMVVDDGDWWLVVWDIGNAGASEDGINLKLYPTDGTTSDVGRATFDCPGMFLNTTIYEVVSLPPFYTTTSSVSVDETQLSMDGINHNDEKGRITFNWMPTFSSADVSGNIPILSNDSYDYVYYDATAGAVVVTDGTNVATKTQAVTANTRYEISFKYSIESGELTVYVDGSAGTAKDYDGSFEVTDKIYIFKDSIYGQRMADFTRRDISDDKAVLISGVVGMIDLNDNIYDVVDVPSTTTVEVALTTAQNYTSGGTLDALEQAYNNISQAFLPRYGWGEPPWGVSYWYGYSEDGIVPNYTVGWFDVVVAEYARIIIDDTDNNDGYVEAGRIKIGARWEPNVNFNWGSTLESVDEGVLSRTRDGSLHSEPGAKYRAVAHGFSFLDLASAMAIDSIYKSPGKDGDVLVSSYPDAGSELDTATTLLGRIVTHEPVARFQHGYSTSFRIEEG